MGASLFMIPVPCYRCGRVFYMPAIGPEHMKRCMASRHVCQECIRPAEIMMLGRALANYELWPKVV